MSTCITSLVEKSKVDVRLNELVVPKYKQFRYIDSLFQEDITIDEDVTHMIRIIWLKWKSTTGVCHKRMSTKVKGKLYKIVMRSVIYIVINIGLLTSNTHNMRIAEMWMLR